LAGLDARQIGLAAVELGAGRTRVEDDVDPAVGFEIHRQVGEEVEAGEPLITVHAASDDQVERARQRLSGAISIEEAEPPARATIRYRVTAEGTTPL
jgi:thymidine phosphorylase